MSTARKTAIIKGFAVTIFNIGEKGLDYDFRPPAVAAGLKAFEGPKKTGKVPEGMKVVGTVTREGSKVAILSHQTTSDKDLGGYLLGYAGTIFGALSLS